MFSRYEYGLFSVIIWCYGFKFLDRNVIDDGFVLIIVGCDLVSWKVYIKFFDDVYLVYFSGIFVVNVVVLLLIFFFVLSVMGVLVVS